MFGLTSAPPNVVKASFDIILSPLTSGIKPPWIFIDPRVKVYIAKGIQDVCSSRHNFIADVHVWSYVSPHCNMWLCEAQGFADEPVENGCLRFPGRDGNHGEVVGERRFRVLVWV